MKIHNTALFALASSLLICLIIGLVGCREDRLSSDSSIRLVFSREKLSFDTVFTTLGSATKQVMVYNRSSNAVEISRVWMTNGSASFFRINLDGENDFDHMRGMQVRGGDSLFLFVRVEIDPQNNNNPVLIEDAVNMLVNGNTCTLPLEAYGQDVIMLRSPKRRIDTASVAMTAGKPYLLYDSLCINGPWAMEEGARLYLHSGATIIAEGNVSLTGSLSKPVRIMGDRIDRLFDSVPYAYAAGGWNGIYLKPAEGTTPTYHFNYAEIISGTNGLIYYDTLSTTQPFLSLHNSRIHNHSQYGLVLNNIKDSIVNCEISNCADHCLYLGKGTHIIVHTTVADYFRNTTINIQSTRRTNNPAVFVNNNIDVDSLVMINCLLAGAYDKTLAFADTIRDGFKARFIGNYLQSDTLPDFIARGNTYPSEENTNPIFRQSFYKYKEYKYYDFHLDSVSPARGIADSLNATIYKFDRDNRNRFPIGDNRADAGCYQHPW